MKKINTLTMFLILSVLVSFQASAQSIIYTQNFDGSQSLPSGWYASPNSWQLDTTGGNASSGYHGATGLNNVAIKDTTGRLGLDSLITAPISTIGYNNITIEWGTRFSKHFADSGSTVSLYWSTNGTAWTSVSYIENGNNSNWELENDSTPIVLPSGAANQAALQFMWVANIKFTPSGTYRIDDLNIEGTPIAGINDVTADAGIAHIYANSNAEIFISANKAIEAPLNVGIYDLAGRSIFNSSMNTPTMSINGQVFAKGIYLVKVYDANSSMVTKVVIQ